MPRPLHAISIRNPTKIQNAFATPVGADRCVGPQQTCYFRARAHTQVRPYRAAMLRSSITQASRRTCMCGGGLLCNSKLRHAPPRSGPGCRGTAHVSARCAQLHPKTPAGIHFGSSGGWVYASTSTFTTALRVGTGSPAGLPGEWGSSGRKMANCPAVRVKSKPFTFSQGR